MSRARHYQRVPLGSRKVEVGRPRAKRKKFPFQGFIDFQGISIDVENVAGSYRRGVDHDGHPWRVAMHHPYGEIRGTEGADGDKLDVYVGPFADSSLVVVVHQQDPKTKVYDEDKVMLGFQKVADALSAYRKQYDGAGFYGGHTTMPIGQFWRWVKDSGNRGRRVVRKAPEGGLGRARFVTMDGMATGSQDAYKKRDILMMVRMGMEDRLGAGDREFLEVLRREDPNNPAYWLDGVPR